MPDYFDFDIELLDMPGERRFAAFFSRRRTPRSAICMTPFNPRRWLGYHLFTFQPVDDEPFAGAVMPDEDDPEFAPAEDVKPSRAFHDDGLFSVFYHYDFGDDWWVMIHFRGIVTRADTFHRKLLDGAGAFPPEDCGGPHGFRGLLKAIEKRAAKAKLRVDEREKLDWLGDDWRDAFSLKDCARSFDARSDRRSSRGDLGCLPHANASSPLLPTSRWP